MAEEMKEKKVKVTLDDVKKQADDTAAKLRMLVKVCERHFGKDLNRDGKIGGAKVALLALLAIGMLAGAAFAVDSEAGDVWNVKKAAVRSNGDLDLDGGVVAAGSMTVGDDLTVSGQLGLVGAAQSVTNNQVITLGASSVVELTGTGGVLNGTNTITLLTPYEVDKLYILRVASGSTNVVKIKDSTTILALGADVDLGPTDTLTIYTGATNEAVKISHEDN